MKKVSLVNDLLYGVIMYLFYAFFISACGHKESPVFTEEELEFRRVMPAPNFNEFYDSLKNGKYGEEIVTDGPDWAHTFFFTKSEFIITLDDKYRTATFIIGGNVFVKIDSLGCISYLSVTTNDPEEPYFDASDIAKMSMDERKRNFVEQYAKQMIPSILQKVRHR